MNDVHATLENTTHNDIEIRSDGLGKSTLVRIMYKSSEYYFIVKNEVFNSIEKCDLNDLNLSIISNMKRHSDFAVKDGLIIKNRYGIPQATLLVNGYIVTI